MRNIKFSLDEACRGHWSPRRALSYGRPLMYVIGPRGDGKSTGSPLFLLDEFLSSRCNNPLIHEYPRSFLVMRPDRKGYAEMCDGYFENCERILHDRFGVDIHVEYKGGSDGGEYVIDDQLAGIGFPLVDYSTRKSTTLRIYNILLDEFVAEGKSNGQSGYNGGRTRPLFDAEAIMSLMTSYDRQVSDSYADMFRNEVRVLHIGNNYSYNVPHYIYHGIDAYLRVDSHFIAPKGKLWMLEQTDAGEEYIKAVENSNVGRLMSDRDRAFSFENTPKTGGDNSCFVAKLRGQRESLCNLAANGKLYGVFFQRNSGVVWVSRKPSDSGMTIALTTDDHRPNYLMALRFSDCQAMKMLRDSYMRGYIRFDSAESKYIVDNYFMYV